MTFVKVMIMLIFTGHIICGICNCLMSFSKTGLLDFSITRDNYKMSYVLGGMPRGTITTALILGSFAILASTAGYIGFSTWMLQYNPGLSRAMVNLGTAIGIFGVIQHVVFGSCEWFYIRSGCTENARKLAFDFCKRLIFASIIYVLALCAFSLILFIVIVTGMIQLPRWTCIFNPILFVTVLMLLNHFLPKKGAGIAQFAIGLAYVGLFLFI